MTPRSDPSITARVVDRPAPGSVSGGAAPLPVVGAHSPTYNPGPPAPVCSTGGAALVGNTNKYLHIYIAQH